MVVEVAVCRSASNKMSEYPSRIKQNSATLPFEKGSATPQSLRGVTETRVLFRTHAKTQLCGILLCLPMAPVPLFQTKETSVRPRFLLALYDRQWGGRM